MTKEEIKVLAEKVYGKCDWHGDALAHLEQLAKLLVEKEREACAKACEEVIFKVKPTYCVVAENCVKVIRARGQE